MAVGRIFESNEKPKKIIFLISLKIEDLGIRKVQSSGKLFE